MPNNSLKCVVFSAFASVCCLVALPTLADTVEKMEINVEREAPEVGIKRLEIIDKTLSKDLIDRKRELVRSIESDYNEKITKLLQGMTNPVIKHNVTTHIDVNYLAPDFETEVQSSQKIAVTILLKKNGFDSWGRQFPNQQAALDAMKQVISNTFSIDPGKVTIVLMN